MTRREFVALAAVARDASIARVAERELTDEYLLLGGAEPAVLGARWNGERRAAPLGSLVKPFVALAFGSAHEFRYPEFTCTGCWLPQGHGRIGITRALAHSCNSYFLELAERTEAADVARVALRFGLPEPGDTTPGALIGRDGKWRATPEAVARAYHELAERRTEPGVPLILAALGECARSGTASAVRARVAAKTGTAPCVHSTRAPGDGLLVALFPGEAPRFVLVVRAHGVPGAECARRSGAFLRAVAG
jgi:hypothetical protein